MGIIAVILGILAVACAALATFLFGTTGGIVAGVIGGCALLLAVFKRIKTGKGGKAAMVISALAIYMAFSLTSTWSAAFTNLHNKALEYRPDGLWAQVTENTDGGLMGIMGNLPNDEATLNTLVEEMNDLNGIKAE